MQNITYTVYVQTDTNSSIIAVDSSAFLSDITGAAGRQTIDSLHIQ